MNVLVLQHSATAGLGLWEPALRRLYHAQLRIVRPQVEDLEDIDLRGIDLVILLGGPASVYRKEPWLEREAGFVRRLLSENRPLLGLCLGAQIIADAAGGHVSAGNAPLLGWMANDQAVAEAWKGSWFRWQSDRVSLPASARPLAWSGATVQAFQLGRAVGVLFHPEMDGETIGQLIDRNAARLRGEGFAPDEVKAEWTRMPDDILPRSQHLLQTAIERCGCNL